MTDGTRPEGIQQNGGISSHELHSALDTHSVIATYTPIPDTPPDPPAKPALGTPAGRIVGIDIARGLAVLGMYAAHLASTPPEGAEEPTRPPFSFTDALTMMVTEDPHSGSPYEVVGSGGFALGVIGLCLLACHRTGSAACRA